MSRFRSRLALLVLVVALSSIMFTSAAAAEDSSPFRAPSLDQPPAQNPEQLASGRDLISNGSFETGDFTGWRTVDMPNPAVAWNVSMWSAPGIGPVPHGTYLAQNGFDGTGPGSYVISQKVRIPAKGRWRLSWRDSFIYDIADGMKPRSQYVEIRTPRGRLLARVYKYSTLPGPSSETVDWKAHSVSLAKFRGTKVKVSFRQYVPQDHTGKAVFQLDDIQITKRT